MRILVLVVVLAGCSKKEKKQEAPPPPPPAVVDAAAAVAPPADAAAPKPELLPAKLGEKDGVVIAEKQGGEVTATVKGQSVAIPDATKVEIVAEKEAMAGASDDATFTVKYEGKDVELRADRVMTESTLTRSPDGKHAVFIAMFACGDLCHTAISLVSADGRRTKLGEAGVDVNVAWTKDKVAVGAGNLWLVSLVDHEVTYLEGYTAPAYSPDGVLYVRNMDGSAFELTGDKPKQVWKAKRKKKKIDDEEDPYDVDYPPPVTFVGGKPKFDYDR